jgi:hypothetical protein
MRRALGYVVTVGGLAIAMLGMRPSPAASVSGHVTVLLLALVPATGAVSIGGLRVGRGRAILTTIAAVVFLGVAVFHPVSDRIPDEDVPKFETVISLEERSARGEPFRRMDGHWYQVKPWIARALFF